ncbi:MAG: hypothetical protein ACPL7L_01685, partial [bacterium]
MKNYLDALKASLLSPQDLVWILRGPEREKLIWLDVALVFILAGLAILSSLLSYQFRLTTLLYFPIAFLLWFICGGIAHVWCFNSKGTATWTETYIATPLALFFPVILS